MSNYLDGSDVLGAGDPVAAMDAMMDAQIRAKVIAPAESRARIALLVSTGAAILLFGVGGGLLWTAHRAVGVLLGAVLGAPVGFGVGYFLGEEVIMPKAKSEAEASRLAARGVR